MAVVVLGLQARDIPAVRPPIAFALTRHQRHWRCVPCKEPPNFLLLETHQMRIPKSRVPGHNGRFEVAASCLQRSDAVNGGF